MSGGGFGNFNIEEHTDFIKKLFEDHALSVNGSLYRFLETELYYHGNGHRDTSVLIRDRNAGDFFFHQFGFDICFRTEKDKSGSPAVYGGVLVRSLKKECGEIICGPMNCSLHILNSGKSKNTGFILEMNVVSAPHLDLSIKRSVRIKGKRDDGFHDALYRFITAEFLEEIMKRPLGDHYRKKTAGFQINGAVS